MSDRNLTRSQRKNLVWGRLFEHFCGNVRLGSKMPGYMRRVVDSEAVLGSAIDSLASCLVDQGKSDEDPEAFRPLLLAIAYRKLSALVVKPTRKNRGERRTHSLEVANSENSTCTIDLPDPDEMTPVERAELAEFQDQMERAVNQIKQSIRGQYHEASTQKKRENVDKAVRAIEIIWERVTDTMQERVILAEVATEVGFSEYVLREYVLKKARKLLAEVFPQEVAQFSRARRDVAEFRSRGQT
jgi:hypothetical protein